MNIKKVRLIAIMLFLSGIAGAQTTEFTYQGKLTDAGTPSATYDFVFRLCDSLAADCSAPLAMQQILDVPVSGSVFTVPLDFGAAVFDGSNRWLEVAVKRPAQPTFTTLTPRQPLTSSPYSVKSLRSFDADNLGGVPSSSFLQSNGDGSNLTNVAVLSVGNVFTASDNSFPQITLLGDGQIIAPRLENAKTEPVAASAANAGRVYFNTTTGSLMISNGSAWINPASEPRQIQTFSGATASASFNCTSTTTAIRTAAFTKSSAASRLRIAYKDTAGAFGPNGFTLFVSVRIDGVLVNNPSALRMAFGSNGGGGLFGVYNSFTTVGYIDGVSAGAHTLTSTYSHSSTLGGTFTCTRDSEPYLLEIEEIQ